MLNETDYKKMSLHDLAMEIRKDWKNVNYAAKPYLAAMATLDSIRDRYMFDSGKSIVAYFLSNASSWRGSVAKEMKKELKRRLNESLVREGKLVINESQLRKIIRNMIRESLNESRDTFDPSDIIHLAAEFTSDDLSYLSRMQWDIRDIQSLIDTIKNSHITNSRDQKKFEFKAQKIIRSIKKKMGDQPVTIYVNNYPWYLKKIDSTHLYMLMDKKQLQHPPGASAHHVGEYRDNSYYKDLVDWLHGRKNIDGNKYNE